MRNIPIRTTQNVIIEYELPSTAQRCFAWGIDFILISLVTWVLTFAYFFMLAFLDYNEDAHFAFVFLVIAPIYLFYSLVCEVFFNGQTIGKKMLGIRVVKLNGGVPSLSDYTIRWVARMVDILFSWGTIAILFVLATEKGQRLGDILAGTTVIRVKSKQYISLRDILKIHNREDYEVTYPRVIQFSEQEMFSIKNVLSRVSRFPKQSDTQKLLRQTVKLSKERLDIPYQGANLQEEKQFLYTLLQDYIVLTR